MKNYKKGLLTVTVLSAMSLMAAEDKTIYVNTLEDQNGEDASKCSLREAIKAAELNKAYGGCTAGNTPPSARDYIQLEAGIYKLNSELVPNSTITILGKAPQDYSKVDVITNDYPAKTILTTIIDGQGKNRLFNTSVSKAVVSLANLQLQNGMVPHDSVSNEKESKSRGGALYLGGTTDLTRVSVLNSSADIGGAIYLEGINSSLTLTTGIYQGNKAKTGSVLAMSCLDNLTYVSRTLAFNYNSFIKNGSADSNSMMAFCGEPSVSFTANTIGKNIASPTQGSIIKFTGDAFTTKDLTQLSNAGNITLLSNTIVENNAYSTFLYDKIGAKALMFNVLGFNSGKSCRYLLGEAKEEKKVGLGLVYNALNLVAGTTGQCDIPEEALEENKTNINIGNVSFSTLLSDLQAPSEYTSFLPLYFARDNKTETDLVDIGIDGCSAQDQRGINRITDGTLILEPDERNSCDIGATENMRLTAGDISNLVNTSQTDLIKNYQTELDFFKDLVADSTTNPDFMPYYNKRVKEYENLIQYTKQHQKYRAVYVDPFAFSLPDEIVKDGSRQIQHLTTDLYSIKVEAMGVGNIVGSGDNAKYEGKPDANLFCEWKPDLKRIMVYRLDDGTTQAGEYNFCKYTISLIADPSKKSSGLMQTNFVNIVPVATNDEYTIQYGSDQKITVNVLENDNDDGDGPVSALKNKPNKPAFYHDSEGIELPIRLTKVPGAITVTGERSGPCPVPDQKETCYGGKLTVQVKNNFNPFTYSFTYVNYDADGAKSNEATVTLKNTAATPGNQSSGGGGSLGVFTLLGLLGLVVYRRRI